MFIDTIKYFQQSLAVLANTVTDKEKQCVKNECKKFIIKHTKLNKKCSVDSQEWVLNYLSSGEGVIPYEMLNRFDSLDISLEESKFFLPHHFYSSLKETTITTEGYNSVKTLYQTIKLENLRGLNKLYNFQDTIILCKTFENRSHNYKDYLNTTLKNIILQVLLVVVFIETKVNV